MPKKRKQASADTACANVLVESRSFNEAGLRPIRPRPLRYDEKLRILWPDDPELEKIDGGAFAKWLKRTDAAERLATSAEQELPVVRRTVKGRKPNSKPSNEQLPARAVSAAQAAEAQPKVTIDVPQFRKLTKKELPATAQQGNNAASNEAPYIRYVGKTQDEQEDCVDYDLETDDEEWLQKRRKKGLEDLDVDSMEHLMDKFEKAKHAVLEQQQSKWERSQDGRKGIDPEEKDPGTLYTASQAMKDLGHEYSSLTLRALHNYWAAKAARRSLPLLQKFWYNKRWARNLAIKTRRDESLDDDDDDETENGLPFQGKDSPKRQGRSRTLKLEDVEDRLLIARDDLERLRTLTDQVKRREKVKKRLLVTWQDEWNAKFALARSAATNPAKGKAKGKATKQAGKVAQAKATGASKGNNKKTAAGKAEKTKALPKEVANLLGTSDSEKAPPSPRNGIVSAVVDQLRRIGSWGNRSPKADAVPEQMSAELPDEVAEEEDDDEDPPAPAQKQGKQKKRVTIAEQPTALLPARNAVPRKPAKAKPQKAADRKKVKVSAEPAKKTPFARKDVQQPKAIHKKEPENDAVEVPAGFERSILAGLSGPKIEWKAKCKHGTFAFSSIAEVQKFLKEHANSRKAWQHLARQPGETVAKQAVRLRKVFSFRVTDEDWPALVEEPAPKPANHKTPKKRGQLAKELKSLGVAGPKGVSKPSAKAKQQATAKTSRRKKDAAVATGVRTRRGLQGTTGEELVALEETQSRRKGRSSHAGDAQRSPSRHLQIEGEEGASGEAWHSAELDNSQESSSGSDTYIPANSSDADSEDGIHSASLPKRRRVAVPASGKATSSRQSHGWAGWRDDNADAGSDMSSFSEGSDMPSLFPAPKPTLASKRVPLAKSRGKPQAASRKKQAVAVAARPRARNAVHR